MLSRVDARIDYALPSGGGGTLYNIISITLEINSTCYVYDVFPTHVNAQNVIGVSNINDCVIKGIYIY